MKSLLLTLMAILFLQPVWAAENNINYTLETSTDKAVEVKVELQTGSESEIEKAIAAKRSKMPQTTVLLSSDIDQILESAAHKNEDLILAPFGDVVQKSKLRKTAELLAAYPKHLYASAKADKIGLMIVTFTTAYDSFMWMHTTGLSTFEASSNAMFTVVQAIVFGINKDSWVHATKPFRKFFTGLIGGGEELKPKSLGDLSARFLASMSLALVLTSARIPMMNFDHMIEAAMRLNTWTFPTLLAVVSTVASFSWSENLASIDEKRQPNAKFVFRRIQELRSIILGTFAATAMLLAPQKYGIAPWLTLFVSGSAGLTIYLNSEHISAWIEAAAAKIKEAIRTPEKHMCRSVLAHN